MKQRQSKNLLFINITKTFLNFFIKFRWYFYNFIQRFPQITIAKINNLKVIVDNFNKCDKTYLKDIKGLFLYLRKILHKHILDKIQKFITKI